MKIIAEYYLRLPVSTLGDEFDAFSGKESIFHEQIHVIAQIGEFSSPSESGEV